MNSRTRCNVLLSVFGLILFSASSLFGEVMLQWFETDWDEMYRRIPEVAESGYNYIWTPPPTKAPVGKSTIWGNVGYSLYDRFDLGDVPQRGTRETRYGTRGSLRNMVDNMHQCDVKIIPDIIMNHNGNGPDIREYPGMKVTDFHVWRQDNYCNDLNYKRAPRMGNWTPDNGYGATMYEDLCSLIDIRTEDCTLTRSWGTADRFTAPNSPNYVAGTSFIRHIGQYDRYPYFNTDSTTYSNGEEASDLLYRWIAWLGEAIDYDGLRLDAGKHTPWEFFGNDQVGFLHEAQYNQSLRRGYTNYNDTSEVFANYIKRKHSLIFAEILSPWDDYREGGQQGVKYWADNNPMRFLDYAIKKTADGALSGNIGGFYGSGTDFGPSKGIMYIWGHDEGQNGKVDLGYAYTLTHIGFPMVYFTGKNISGSDSYRTWMIPGYDDYALGDGGSKVANMVWINNNFAWGKEWNRWADGDFLALERFDDLNPNGSPDAGEGILLVALNDSGGDITHDLDTCFSDGTVLKDYTGHGTDITISGGKAHVTVPGNYGQGWVCYAPYTPDPTISVVGASDMNWIVPGGTYGSPKSRSIPRITASNFTVQASLSSATASHVLLKWGQGLTQVGSGTHYTNDDLLIRADYEDMTGSGTAWSLAVNNAPAKIPEGLNTIKVRAFVNWPGEGSPALFNTATKVVYVDLHGPELNITYPAADETIRGEGVMTIENTDFTAYGMTVSLNGGAVKSADEVMKGLWKFNLSGLSAGTHTARVTTTEANWGSPRAVINTSVYTRVFNVAANTQPISLSHAENATNMLPFFLTGVTASGSPSTVRLYWDGYELPLNAGNYTNVFNGEVVQRDYLGNVVTNRLWGNFINGPHFFEAERVDGGVTSRVSRRVVFNLYGKNHIDSDGDGIPDNVEIPFFDTNAIPGEKIPGDDNQNSIPDNFEQWSRLNPYNHSTFYSGQWDDQNDFDGDGYSNYEEVYAGFVSSNNVYAYDIYNAASHPVGTPSVPAEVNYTPDPATRTNNLTITYKTNQGPLENASAVNLYVGHSKRTFGEWQGVESVAMNWDAGNSRWTVNYMVPSNATSVDFVFNDGVDIWDNNSQRDWQVTVAGDNPEGFVMDGEFDSDGYTVISYGMKIQAAVKGANLYVATWGAGGGGNDHFLYVAPALGNASDPAPGWNKAGKVFFDTAQYPYITAEGSSGWCSWNQASGLISNKPGSALEGVINLVDTFGYIPEAIYVASVAYGTDEGGGITSQSPLVWDANNNVEIMEFQRLAVSSLLDINGDGVFDCGAPIMETTVNENTQDANYGLRRFFINEMANEEYSITVKLTPNAGAATLTDVELFSNLNRRDFAVMPGEEDPDSVSTASASTYYRAYSMSSNGDGSYSVTVPVNRCGAYRINARYRVNGGDYVYYTDHGLRRDCAVVVSPKKALELTMYELNPLTAEATNNFFEGRSTFADMVQVNADRPDRISTNYFKNLGVNMVWLQPIHPIGSDGRQTDPITGSAYDPGSPYAVKNYWKVNGVLGEPYTSDGSQAMTEFTDFVAAYDASGIGVMLDGTFNHSAWDCEIGQPGVDLFDWATTAANYIRDIKPAWYAKNTDYGQRATYYGSEQLKDIGSAPDRIDFGKWEDAAEFNYGTYDCLVQGQGLEFAEGAAWNSQWFYRFLLEEDRTDPLDATTKEVWEYFSYYPEYWLAKTGHPRGTPKSESYKGIDGLRCDFAQGLPSEFWEYSINKTRSIKWDFLFMAESLDGYKEVGTSKQHGVGFRSSRHFDILNENLVFYWRNDFFKEFPGGGAPTNAVSPNRSTSPTQTKVADRKEAFANVPLLLNLTSHDEILPTAHQPSLMYAYAELSALAGVPMILYGQEAGMQNDYETYNTAYNYYDYEIQKANNVNIYEMNFGKSIPNFKRYNSMTSVWHQGSTWMQGLYNSYGRINGARLRSPALQSQNDYFLSQSGGAGINESIFAVAKYEAAGVSAASQDVVFAFVNNDCQANDDRAANYDLDVDFEGKNWFGIESGHSYNVVDLASTNPTTFVWGTSRTAADLLATGLYVGLNGDAWQGKQAQFLKLMDVAATYPTDAQGLYAGSKYSDWDWDKDGLNNDWEIAHGLNPNSATGVNGADGDFDGDGSSNNAELLAGTNPNDINDVLSIEELVLNGSQLTLTWASKPNINYQILYKNSLLNAEESWKPYGPLRTALNTDTTVSNTEGAGDTNRYFRVRVQP